MAARQGLLSTGEEEVEQPKLGLVPPTTVEATQAAMPATSPGTATEMRQKSQAGLSIRGNAGALLSTGDGRAASRELMPKQYIPRTYTPREPYDPEPENPLVSKLSTIDDYGIKAHDITNFLFGSEMGVVGAKWDSNGFSWDWENAKQQWSEQPLWLNLLATTSLFGTAMFPVGRAAYMTTKVGKVGEALGLTGSHADEVMRWKTMGLMDAAKTTDLTYDQRVGMRLSERNYDKVSARLDRVARAERGEPLGAKERIMYEFEKRFANKHNELGRSIAARANYGARLDEIWKNENLGRFLQDVPDDIHGPNMMQHWLHSMDPTNVPKPTGLGPKEMAWADNLADAMRNHNDEAFAEGVIDQVTHQSIPMHFPAQFKGTPTPDMGMDRTFIQSVKTKQIPGDVVQGMTQRKGLAGVLFGRDKPTAQVTGTKDYVAVHIQKIPRLDSKTLESRTKNLPEVYKRLQAGQLITSPRELTVRGYIMDRLLLNNFKFVRDASIDPRYAVPHMDVAMKFTNAQGVFDHAAAKAAGYVSLDSVGSKPVEILQRMIQKKGGKLGANGELPWIRKEIFDEVFGAHTGTFAQSQQVINMFDIMSSSMKTMKTVWSIPTHFNNMAGTLAMVAQGGMNPFSPRGMAILQSSHGALEKLTASWKVAKAGGIDSKDIFAKGTFNLGETVIDGKKYNLNDEFLDPTVRELFEENTLDATEGASHLIKMFEQAKQGSITKGVLRGVMGVKNIMQAGDKVKLFDRMTKAYTYEDMIPKMGYYLHMRSQGYSKLGAVLETGRRLPMYNNVGSAIVTGRKVMFPWATFTTEATRITKNNLMDHPLRMMPWLQVPGIMQGLAAGMEGRSYEEVEGAKRSLPLFAQSPTTLIAGAGTQRQSGATATGALSGATAGLLRGGPRAGMIGGLVGGAAGYLGAKKIAEWGGEGTDELRGAMMEWLPHAAFMVTTNSPDFEWTMRTALEQMPSQPLALVKPIMDVAIGQTAWGQEIGSEGFGDSIGKGIAGMIGLLAPPVIQKYGFKVTTPDVAVSESMFRKLGVKGKIPGDITNWSRFLTDTGIAIDPATGKPGSLTQDFILNNSALWKSYAAGPATRLANEGLADKNQEKVRTYFAKNLDYYLANGMDEPALGILSKVQRSFAKQHLGDPTVAQEKYEAWLKKRLKKIGQHPRLSSWSNEELSARFQAASDFAKEARGQAREELLKFIRDEQSIRQMESGGGEFQESWGGGEVGKKGHGLK